MPSTPSKVDTVERLNQNLGLLQSGAPITIDISTPAGQKGKFRSIFVGFLPKQYVLVQFPDNGKLGNFSQYITQGAGITVRGLIEGHEGAVVAFVSNVKQTLQIPSRLIVLDFPRSVGVQSLRSSLRIDTSISAKVKVAAEYWQAVISDVSIHGCQLSVNDGEALVMAKEKPVEIVVENFEGLQNVKLFAQICSVKQQVQSVSIGVKFSDECKEEVTKLIQNAVIAEF